MDSSNPANFKPCVIKFYKDNECVKAATLADLAKGKIQETFNWKVKGISGLEMLNQADNKVIYKCDKGSFGHSYYTMIDRSGKTERNLFMYLRETETSKRYGYNQPRTYIDVNPEANYSSIDNHNSRLCFFNH